MKSDEGAERGRGRGRFQYLPIDLRLPGICDQDQALDFSLVGLARHGRCMSCVLGGAVIVLWWCVTQ